ncbi:MAG: SGNH/GDSL hydrolase family protein [Clostridia bacterium]|nr:SGNH/GDSL hydrolase family protein [Clostridia bacterium]
MISINGIGPSGTTTLNNAGMSAGNFKVEEYVYDADNTEKPLSLVKSYPTITIGRVAETDDETTDGWVKFSFAYNEDGTAQFTFINGGHIYSLSTQNTTSAENKFFAMAKLTGVNIQNLANPIYYGGRLYVDNLEITFEEDENLAYYAKANDYRVEWEELFLRNADFVAPYDVAEITAAKAAYDSLDDKVKAHLTNEGVTAKLTAFVNAAAKWDVTDDASIVASYKTNFATINASNYKIAYNVYNRLTAAQKAELKSEYEAMLALFAAEEQVANTTDIVVMGDSNTAGFGVVSNNDTSKRWTTLLGNKLGSDYTVSNGGISGYRLVNDTTNIEGLQFRDAGSVLWTQSHTMGFDMVVVALGTNDASLINNEAKAEKWEALYEEFVQSYLALENSPTLVLANFGRTKNLTSTERDTGYERVNAVIKNIADKYGITLIDIDAMYDVSLNLFQSDNLHWNEAGHEWMADHYEKAITEITANAYSLAGQKVFYDYSSDDITASVNGFAPEIVSATIKNSTVNQDMRFMVTVSKNVPAGKEIAEYGMVLADYRNITNGTLSFKDMTCDSDSKYLIIGKSSSASNDNLGMTYYVNVGGIDASKYGAPIIARAYVKCTDGTVYYSLNTTEGGDYAARKGVKDGYIVRSIISITKAMLIHLNKNSVDVSSVVKIENDAIVAYISANGTEANVPDDATRLFKIIKENVAILERQ